MSAEDTDPEAKRALNFYWRHAIPLQNVLKCSWGKNATNKCDISMQQLSYDGAYARPCSVKPAIYSLAAILVHIFTRPPTLLCYPSHHCHRHKCSQSLQCTSQAVRSGLGWVGARPHSILSSHKLSKTANQVLSTVFTLRLGARCNRSVHQQELSSQSNNQMP